MMKLFCLGDAEAATAETVLQRFANSLLLCFSAAAQLPAAKSAD
jgi:hypothetical protein